MSNIKPTKQEDHVEHLLHCIRQSKELGQYKRLRYWVGTYLNSYDAKWIAVRRANGHLKLDRRFGKGELLEIVDSLDPWKGTKEEVLVHLKRKPSNPCDFRVYMAFGIENRALQYLLLRPLEILADIAPYQYTIRGGRHAAIKLLAKTMSAGPVWAIELDINNCYPSFDGKKLPSWLPVPEEVSTHVLISEYLYLKGGNILYHFGPTGDDDPGAPFLIQETLVEARRGIPQGSATSPIIAEMMLAMALKKVPDLGDKIAYGDNSLFLAKDESDLVTMTQALESALKAHPVGLFWPKAKPFHPGQPIEFLGHSLIPKSDGKIRIGVSPKNREKFEGEMVAKLRHLQFAKLGPIARARQFRELTHYVRSWTAAFSLCEGIDYCRSYWLTKVAKAGQLED